MNTIAEFSDRFSELIGDESYTKVGETIGLSKQTVSAYANGERSPKKPTIQAIAMHYGVSPAWLIGLDVPKYIKKPTPESERKSESIDSGFFRVMQSAKNKGYTPEDMQLALDFLDRARKRDQE